MKISVSDPKTKKAYPKTIENNAFFKGKKIGNEVELGLIGLDGYKAIITGGSDKQGFPMKHDFEGTNRKKLYLIKNVKKGLREKVSKRGNEISDETAQVNLKITKEGKVKLEELLGGEKAEHKDGKKSFTEKAVEQSLENVGKIDASAAKDIKGKIKK